jgi:hypothetical protein
LAASGISAIQLGPFRLQDYKERYRMVQILRRGQIAVFRVFDREGKPIGDVVQPKSTPVVGLGARTVLLVRGDEAAVLPLPA